ncbi:MAG: ROK family protein [Phycisphaerae bacterium]|nr:ROK family protein [Phycisphaerae bacterium]
MAERLYCGVDFGGTNIKAGLVRASDRAILSQVSIETGREHGPGPIIGRMIRAAQTAVEQAGVKMPQVTAIGIGSPGPLSHKRGVVFESSNLPGWRCEPVVQQFQKETGRPATLENDGNAAAWGEFWAGAGRDVNSLVFLTLGTGIGGGIIVERQLIRGGRENGAELGHMIVQAGGRPCTCGQSGCLETYASAWKMATRFIEALDAGEKSALSCRHKSGLPITSKEIVEAAAGGDPLAARIWEEACYYLAVGCVSIARVINPDRILLAGGMIAAGEKMLLNPVRAKFAELNWKLRCDGMSLEPEISFASLGNNTGIMGAAGAVELAINEGTIKLN